MKKLKGEIIRTFLVCMILLSVAESSADYVLEHFLLPYYAVLGTAQTAITMTGYIAVSLALLALTAWKFSSVIGKKLETEMLRQNNERNMLYANITHDLKTPITSILGFSKALKDNKLDDEQQEQLADIICQKAKRTNELLDTLFLYTKLGTESYQPDETYVDLCAVLRNVTAMHYEAFEKKSIELDIDIPDSKNVILCNEQQITRAIENIIINAYKHNSEGDRVGIFLTNQNSQICLSVADNGREIASSQAEKIFEPFILGDESRSPYKGSGLGLAITKKIVEMYGGSVYVQHRDDGYTKAFVVRF